MAADHDTGVDFWWTRRSSGRHGSRLSDPSTAAANGTQRVHGWTGPVTITCPTTDNSAGTYADGTTIYTISATTSFNDPSLGFFGRLGFTAPSISVTHKERFIGPG
jgi:hypothetical protein